MSRNTHLGDLQLAIMRELWTRGEATVAEVHGALLDERGLALTTIATMLSDRWTVASQQSKPCEHITLDMFLASGSRRRANCPGSFHPSR